MSKPQFFPLRSGQNQPRAGCVVGMRLREVKSEESSCPSVGKQKGSGKETILPGTLGAPCPLSLEAEAGNDISQAPAPSSCRRCPRLAAQTGQPGTSLLVLLGGAPGGGRGWFSGQLFGDAVARGDPLRQAVDSKASRVAQGCRRSCLRRLPLSEQKRGSRWQPSTWGS